MKLKGIIAICLTLCTMFTTGEYLVKAEFNGDLNGDKKIDKNDLSELSKYFNSKEKKYDFNGDGVVDIFDMSYFERNMGTYSFETEYSGAVGVTRDYILYLRPEPKYESKSDILVPIGSKVYIHSRIDDFYKVTYIDEKKKVLSGFITRYADIIKDDETSSFLGVLSERYESNGDPGCISTGEGDYGGKSYGAWQLSSRMGSVDSFLIWLKEVNKTFYSALDQARKSDQTGPGSFGENFDTAWKNIASSNYNEFLKLQQSYIKIRYYDDLVNKLSSEGIYLEQTKKFTTRNILWSLAVQHGSYGAKRLIINSAAPQDHTGFINSIYEERSKVDVYFLNSQKLHASLKNRFNNEKNDALRMLNLENAMQ
jgi:hypothetical protein